MIEMNGTEEKGASVGLTIQDSLHAQEPILTQEEKKKVKRKYVNEDSHNVIEHLEILLNNIRNQWEDGCLSKLYVL